MSRAGVRWVAGAPVIGSLVGFYWVRVYELGGDTMVSVCFDIPGFCTIIVTCDRKAPNTSTGRIEPREEALWWVSLLAREPLAAQCWKASGTTSPDVACPLLKLVRSKKIAPNSHPLRLPTSPKNGTLEVAVPNLPSVHIVAKNRCRL